MDALVLAAGFGSRLSGAVPKPLTPVGGIPLIDRAIDGMFRAGVARVAVVTGHAADEVEAHLEARWGATGRVRAARNDRPELSNGVSVLVGAAHVARPFLIAMADHVVDDAIWRAAVAHSPSPGGATLLVDRRIDEVFDLADATKVRTDGGRIVAIGKQLSDYDAIDVGVFVASDGLVQSLEQVLAAQGDASLSAGVGALAAAGRMATLDIGAAFWQDVDTPQMLARAEEQLSSRR